jgi:hypothetical protein
MVKSTPAPEAVSSERSDEREGPLSASFVADVRRVHEKCSGLLDHFISDAFGKSLEQIPAQAEKFFDGSAAPVVPDLSSLGYAFDGAGPCTIPGGKTLHLLYRHRTDEHDHISVFIQSDQGQLQVEPDKLLRGVGHDPQHPILALRRRGLIYYITADTPAPAEQTAAVLSSQL